MKKLLKFYRRLTPQTRFWLIFFVLASIIWVPVRVNTGVEVYESYRYDIDDVEENQVVFAYQYTNFAWGAQDELWVIGKDGTCKYIDLTGGDYSYGYTPDELTDEELLERMDDYMQDATLQKTDKKLVLDKEKMNYCINILSTELWQTGTFATDSGGGSIYVVAGTGKDRQLKVMREEGYPFFSNGDLWVNLVCDRIRKILWR